MLFAICTAACVPRAVRPITFGSTVSGEIDDTAPKTSEGYPSARYTFHGEKGVRIIAETHVKSLLDPEVDLERNGRKIASSSYEHDGYVLRARLPEDGEYTLVVHFGANLIGDYTVTLKGDTTELKREREAETTRAGTFGLVWVDESQAFFVDFAHLERTGEILKSPIIAMEYVFAMGEGHVATRRLDLESNCIERKQRITAIADRVVNDSGHEELRPQKVSAEQAAWQPASTGETLFSELCAHEVKTPALSWPDLEHAQRGLLLAAARGRAENRAVELQSPVEIKELVVGAPASGTLPARSEQESSDPLKLPYIAFSFKAKAGQLYDVPVKAAFRPYVRIRTREKYLASTWTRLTEGDTTAMQFTAPGAEGTGDVDLVAELTSFDPEGGQWELTVLPHEEPKPRPDPKVRVIDLARVITQSLTGSSALKRFQEARQKNEASLKPDLADIEHDREELEKLRKVFAPKELEPKERALQEKEAALKKKRDQLDADLDKQAAEAMRSIGAHVREIVDEVAREQDLDLVLKKREGLLDGAALPDITDEVLRRYDAKEKP